MKKLLGKMNNLEQGLLIFSGVIGAIIFCLTVTLFSLIVKPWWHGALLGLGIFSVFGGIIVYGLRQHRVRRILEPIPANPFDTSSPEIFRIELQETQVRWKKHQAWQRLCLILGFLSIFNLVLILQFSYTGDLWKALGIVNGGFLLMALVVFPFRNTTLSRGRKLVSRLVQRTLVCDAHGLSIPIELVTEPALHIAVEAGETEVHLTWADITGWEVSDGMGKAPAQHSLSVRSSNRYSGLFHRFGLIRTPEVLRHETELIAYARRHLSRSIDWAAQEKSPV